MKKIITILSFVTGLNALASIDLDPGTSVTINANTDTVVNCKSPEKKCTIQNQSGVYVLFASDGTMLSYEQGIVPIMDDLKKFRAAGLCK